MELEDTKTGLQNTKIVMPKDLELTFTSAKT